MDEDAQDLGSDVEHEHEHEAAQPGYDAVRRVAAALSDEEASGADKTSALEYLLSAAQEDTLVERALRVNVGSPTAPKYVRWVIQNIPGAQIRKIREDAEEQARRSKGGSGTSAGFNANVRVVIEGTVDPDIKAGARQLNIIDPADFLETALSRKQGLIDQIAGSILSISGYDDEDVNDEIEARAAGNS